MIVERFPSLSLRWLSRLQKDLPTPLLIFDYWDAENSPGGIYWEPGPNGTEEYEFVDSRNGVIFINTYLNDDVGDTIAHEWRHHYQYWQLGFDFENTKALNYSLNYDDMIREYNSQWHEMDAVMFSHRVHPTECTEECMDILNGLDSDYSDIS